jgi:cysteine desulfurase
MSPIAASERNDSTKRVYLDHAAATPVSPIAQSAMDRAQHLFGNPSSLHEEGRLAKRSLDASRIVIVTTLNAHADELIFTASGSESDALAIIGAARAYKKYGSHIIVSAIEHKAVLQSAEALAKEGFEISYLVPDADGRINPNALAELLRPDTILVSIMYANNEIGTVQPIRELAEIVRAHRKTLPVPLFHTDACQAPGLLPIDVQNLGVDLLTINSSKVYGPKGVGALFVKSGVLLEPIIFGEQERGRRGGTESVVLAAGFAAALAEAAAMREAEVVRLAELRELFFAEIQSRIPDVVINGSREHRLANNVHISIPRIEGESILLLLDNNGIACSTGSACNASDLVPSHVLRAIGQDTDLLHGSIRLTLGRSTARDDVLYAVRMLGEATARLRGMTAIAAPTLV